MEVRLGEMAEKEVSETKEELLLPLEEMLAGGLHIGTRVKTEHMEPYIYRVRPDGLFILNIGETDRKIRVAAKFIARFDPSKVIVVSSRLYGKTPVEKFCELTGATPVIGRFLPGYISNPLHPNHIEPSLILVTDPRADWQAIKEASGGGIPVVALCDTDNVFTGVDLAIPTNNKGRRALAMIYWLLARQVLRERGTIPPDGSITPTVEDFETKLTATQKIGGEG
ncbi:MAG: 30S ribosomal protein S2 [Candidatus Bathyarchaeia archaeon]